jgi:hypothetical protein
MAIFSKKKKKSAMEHKLDQSTQGDDLQDLQPMDYGFDNNMRGQPNPFTPPHQQPAYPQQDLAPQSVNTSNTQLVMNKIDILDAKIDELGKRLEVMEKLIQALHQQQPSSPYQGNQRRTW